MDIETRNQYRNSVFEGIERDLVGPAGGETELVKGQIFNRYLCGMLFPANLPTSDLGESDDPEVHGTEDETKGSDNSLSMAYEALPASMGISFFVKGAKRLIVHAEAGRYTKFNARTGGGSTEEEEQANEESSAGDEERSSEAWVRHPLGSKHDPSTSAVEVPEVGRAGTSKQEIFEGRAQIHAHFRPRNDGHLVTVTLLNYQVAEEGRHSEEYATATLFQCRFRVVVEDGAIGEYPTVDRFSMHREDEELRLVYRNRKTFGIGHGCAASWDPSALESISELKATPLPKLEVRGLTNDIEIPEAARIGLNLRWLADPQRTREDFRGTFEPFVAAYRDWIERQRKKALTFTGRMKDAAFTIVERQTRAADRMEAGVDSICADGFNPNFEAFKLAQSAMLRQFLWSESSRKGPYELGKAPLDPIDPLMVAPQDAPKWRPFQLAFQLLSVESLANHHSPDRDTMDLLWFPTGGGKTEAYLALTAFEIARRRIVFGESGGGTSVWMRYTLRLLTSQQFERCATLISAMEFMRTSGETLELGAEPISLGLWVGGETSPNHLDNDNDRSPGARQLYERMRYETEPQNRFQLTSCPRCGTLIVPSVQSDVSHYGIEVTSSSFRMFCPDTRCELHSRIPVSVVDTDLYNKPPTVLIGTIDKFARMVWVPDARVFLGYGGVNVEGRLVDVFPPTLIVQDELHLINGPLGTIAGVYEAALDTAIKKKMGHGPKYLAATATIQRASEQVKSLYGRDVLVFPPSGLDVEDSFFSKEDTKEPGRLYVGAMNNGLYSSITTLVQASGACAQAVQRLDKRASNTEQDAVAIDSYWTQVVYHNSRQELGKTTTMLRDDVSVRLEILEPDAGKRRPFDQIEELSANLKGAEVAKALSKLGEGWPSREAIDALPCTNMISVGVDVARLGLMIVKGQPKSTAEYIQASSRVGRNSKRPGGIVLTLFSATRPRDRSHFETFQSYHQALYRLVEPTTVTPFASPALDRTLHAALVLAVRYALGWIENNDAGRFDPRNPEVKEVIELLKARLLTSVADENGSEWLETVDRLDELVEYWTKTAAANPKNLRFNGRMTAQFEHLLVSHPARRDSNYPPWPTLHSMRHVDGETKIQVRGELAE